MQYTRCRRSHQIVSFKYIGTSAYCCCTGILFATGLRVLRISTLWYCVGIASPLPVFSYDRDTDRRHKTTPPPLAGNLCAGCQGLGGPVSAHGRKSS
jgi:hypothetical protein